MTGASYTGWMLRCFPRRSRFRATGSILATILGFLGCSSQQTKPLLSSPEQTPGVVVPLLLEEERLAVDNHAHEPTETADEPTDGIRVFYGLEEIRRSTDRTSALMGLSRAGQVLRLKDSDPIEKSETPCRGGWYALEPYGHVCIGFRSSRNIQDPMGLAMAELLPSLKADLPFETGYALGSPKYLRVPTEGEMRVFEPNLEQHLAKLPIEDGAGRIEVGQGDEIPGVLIEKVFLQALLPSTRESKVHTGLKVAWSRSFSVGHRTLISLSDGGLIPRDRVRVPARSNLRGIRLDEPGDMALPMAFAHADSIEVYDRVKGSAMETTGKVLPRQTFMALAEGKEQLGLETYLPLRAGGYIKASTVRVLHAVKELPQGIKDDEKWIRVNIWQGSLIAYKGLTPVFATAISVGVDGAVHLSDPKLADSMGTPIGRFRVGWKHVTADMSGGEGKNRWRVPEVPWVMYFHNSYALHGAWWHDDFGTPKSHGCVNLSPHDARWLFHWADPPLPPGWYSVASREEARGTLVDIVP